MPGRGAGHDEGLVRWFGLHGELADGAGPDGGAGVPQPQEAGGERWFGSVRGRRAEQAG
ncbi:hypothetical protein ACWCO0_21625 [Streptomyces tubercidicus]